MRARVPGDDRLLARPRDRHRGTPPALRDVREGHDAQAPDRHRGAPALHLPPAPPGARRTRRAAPALHPPLEPEPLRRADARHEARSPHRRSRARGSMPVARGSRTALHRCGARTAARRLVRAAAPAADAVARPRSSPDSTACGRALSRSSCSPSRSRRSCWPRPSSCSGSSMAPSSRATAISCSCWRWASDCCSWSRPRLRARGRWSSSTHRRTCRCSGTRACSRTCCACRSRGSSGATSATSCRASVRWRRCSGP